MSRQDYDERRRFDLTPEPRFDDLDDGRAAAAASGGRRRFVAQLHRATARHVDLRLEHRGTLLSWAVPKGPTLAPGARRLAVRTEDHPLAYAWFEGVIPSGYGAGDVIVWDDGWWQPVDEDGRAVETDTADSADLLVDAMLADGRLRFVVHGRKLAGRFTLVRTRDDQWLLLHGKDDAAVPGWEPDSPMRSVLSGRSNDEVRGGAPARWAAPTDDELTALDELGAAGPWQIGDRTLELTKLDKVLVPGRDDTPPTTKRDLIRHYATMAPALAPYLAGRPVNLNRFPDGSGHGGFWQRSVPQGAPDWIRRWTDPVRHRGRYHTHVVFDGAASLAWAASIACVEIHPWTSLAVAPDEPTWVYFDIDPGPDTTWDEVLVLARLYRTALEHLGLEGGAKVTGGSGIHVWVPVEPRLTFEQTRTFAGTVSRTVGGVVPDLVSWKWHRSDRRGRARLDDTQNARHKTLVAPFSVRPSPGAPVAVPIRWDELDDEHLASDGWTVHTVGARLAEVGDPLAPLTTRQQPLPDM